MGPDELGRLSDREFSERVRLYASLIVTDDYEAARQAGASLIPHVQGRTKEVLEAAGVTLARGHGRRVPGPGRRAGIGDG